MISWPTCAQLTANLRDPHGPACSAGPMWLNLSDLVMVMWPDPSDLYDLQDLHDLCDPQKASKFPLKLGLYQTYCVLLLLKNIGGSKTPIEMVGFHVYQNYHA